MPATGIKITGQITSHKAITPEQLDMLNWHLEQNDLKNVAVASVNVYNGTRIDFSYEGLENLHMNPQNFAFGEKVARIVETCEELSLGLTGIVVIHDTGMRIGGNAQKLVVSGGVTELIYGFIEAGHVRACFAELGTVVQTRPLPLNFA